MKIKERIHFTYTGKHALASLMKQMRTDKLKIAILEQSIVNYYPPNDCKSVY